MRKGDGALVCRRVNADRKHGKQTGEVEGRGEPQKRLPSGPENEPLD